MFLDAQERQLGIEHYENFYTETTGLKNPRAYQAASPQAESDEVYELIDDIIPLSLNESTNNASSKRDSSLIKRKYPKTNPNYSHSNIISNS